MVDEICIVRERAAIARDNTYVIAAAVLCFAWMEEERGKRSKDFAEPSEDTSSACPR